MLFLFVVPLLLWKEQEIRSFRPRGDGTKKTSRFRTEPVGGRRRRLALSLSRAHTFQSGSDLVRINGEQMFTGRKRGDWHKVERRRNISYVDGVVDVLLVAVENVQADGECLNAALRPAVASRFLLLFLLFLLLFLFLLLLIAVLLFFLLFETSKSSY